MLHIYPGATNNSPLHLRVGHGLWVRFGRERSYSWSRPSSTAPGVARFRSVTRCRHGVVVALLEVGRVGRATLTAAFTSSEPSPPGYEWRDTALVTQHGIGPTRPPRSARTIQGGGLLVYPGYLNLDGVSTSFRVPAVRCVNGHGFRADIGTFGIHRRVPPSGPVTTARWFAGLTIRCTSDGQVHYRVGLNHHADLGSVRPGDEIETGASGGGGCSSPDLGINYADSNGGRVGIYPCRAGKHDRIRLVIDPTMLFGAHVLGTMPRRVRLPLSYVSVNDQPYRLQSHDFVDQISHRRSAVATCRTPSWYRVRLILAPPDRRPALSAGGSGARPRVPCRARSKLGSPEQ